MRVIYTLSLAAIAAGISHAQVTIGSESQPQIGDQWAYHNLILPLAENPIPATGLDVAYDFSFIGDEIDTDLSPLPINMVDLDDMTNLRVREVFTQDDVAPGEGTLPDFPSTAVASELYVPNDYNFSLISFIDVLPAGIFQLGQAFYAPGSGLSFIEFLSEPELNVPFDFALGDSLFYESSDVVEDTDFMSEDSSYTASRFVYLGTGSLVTHFGTYDEIAVVRDVEDIQLWSRDLGSAEPFQLASRQIQVYYEFVLPGSFAPLITYDYSSFDLATLAPASDNVNIAFGQPRILSSTQPIDAKKINLSVFPNPAEDQITLSFEQELTSEVQLSLIDQAGRVIKVWTSAGLHPSQGSVQAGQSQYSVSLPATIPAGSYLLRLQTANQLATVPVIIKP